MLPPLSCFMKMGVTKMADIKALIQKRNSKHGRLTMKDVNHDLLISLLATSVYGREARDEEILTAIINAGSPGAARLEAIRADIDVMTKGEKLKKTKMGWVNSKGHIVIMPKGGV